MPSIPTPYWNLHAFPYTLNEGHSVVLRAGYIEASPNVEFKGNILYYQGLGDSILNHDPLFLALREIGYKVIAFDYMGQGGSEGSMNRTTIQGINEIGDLVWKEFATVSGQQEPQMNIIGWSAGGLAAYRRACFSKKDVRKLILIAPGIAVNCIVGEGLKSFRPNKITLRTLTNAKPTAQEDPHVDPIKPQSPVEVPLFTLNLLKTAWLSQRAWKIPKHIQGHAFLSGPNDNYVDAENTLKVIQSNASHFKTHMFSEALHEIDNETPRVANKFRQKVLQFLNEK